MKIAFLSGGLNRFGGTERVLSQIANNLSEKGYETVIVSMCGESKSFFPLNEQIKTYYLNSPGFSKKILSTLAKLKKIIGDEKPDVWIDVDYILGVYSGIVRKAYPEMKWISWEHFCFYYNFPYYVGLRKAVRKYVCRKVDYLVVLSKEDQRDYTENIKRINAKLVQIYNPIPERVFDETENRQKIVLAAGRLTKIKGFETLLEIWAKIEKDNPEWKLVIAGDGEERETLINKIDSLGLKNVEMTGLVENMDKLYEEASVYAMSSKNEGFAMVLLEAMGYGLPCIAFDCKCGVKEAVCDGKNGYVINSGNIDDYAYKLQRIMTDEVLRKEMSENAIKMAEMFKPEIMVKEWVKLFDSMKA